MRRRAIAIGTLLRRLDHSPRIGICDDAIVYFVHYCYRYKHLLCLVVIFVSCVHHSYSSDEWSPELVHMDEGVGHHFGTPAFSVPMFWFRCVPYIRLQLLLMDSSNERNDSISEENRRLRETIRILEQRLKSFSKRNRHPSGDDLQHTDDEQAISHHDEHHHGLKHRKSPGRHGPGSTVQALSSFISRIPNLEGDDDDDEEEGRPLFATPAKRQLVPSTAETSLESSYFDDDDNDDSTFFEHVKDRGMWLVGLLLLQSLSSFIIRRNQVLLQNHSFIVQFLTMLVGAGGNGGNQASVNVIRGLAVDSIGDMRAFLWKEFAMGISLALLLGTAGAIRAACFSVPIMETLAITMSLGTCILFAVIVVCGSTVYLFQSLLSFLRSFSGPCCRLA